MDAGLYSPTEVSAPESPPLEESFTIYLGQYKPIHVDGTDATSTCTVIPVVLYICIYYSTVWLLSSRYRRY